MLIFWILCALMVLLAFSFVLPALLKQDAEPATDEARASSLIVYQDQYRELDADFKAGLLNEEQYQAEKEEIERRLLEEVRAKKDSPARAGGSLSRKLAFALVVLIPVGAILFYLWVGNPKALQIQPAQPSTFR